MNEEKLMSFVSRIECVEVEQAELHKDKWRIYAEAWMAGFDTNAMKEIIAERQRTKERKVIDANVQAYSVALGTGVNPANDGFEFPDLQPSIPSEASL